MYMYVFVCMQICTYIYIYICIYMYIYMYICISMYTYNYICIYVYVCIYKKWEKFMTCRHMGGAGVNGTFIYASHTYTLRQLMNILYIYACMCVHMKIYRYIH